MVVLLLSHLFLFPAAGQMVMAGQRVVGPTGGQVLMARPQGQQQGQLVRTSTGQLLMQQPQQQQQQLGGQTVIRQQLGGVAGSGAAAAGVAQQKVVINQPGLRPGQPGSQITVPLATLQVESRVRVRSCVNQHYHTRRCNQARASPRAPRVTCWSRRRLASIRS